MTRFLLLWQHVSFHTAKLGRPVHRACLKVSGYEVIGRARGDLGENFGANVRVKMKFIDLPLYFFDFSKLSVLTLEHVQSTRPSFGFTNMNLMSFYSVFLFCFVLINPKRLFYSAWVVMTSDPNQKKSKGAFRIMTQKIWRNVLKIFHKNS